MEAELNELLRAYIEVVRKWWKLIEVSRRSKRQGTEAGKLVSLLIVNIILLVDQLSIVIIGNPYKDQLLYQERAFKK